MKIKIITFLMSMVPVIELRGAIPYGVLNGLSVIEATAISIVGNLVPVPFLVLLTTTVFAWLRTKSKGLNGFVTSLEEKGRSKIGQVERYKFWGLMLLVAIPLPGTGAWTGCLVAALMEMDLRKAFPPIVLGVVIAGVVVSTLTYGLGIVL